MKKIKTLTLTLGSDNKIKGDAAKLRGFFATKFNEYQLLHQHDVDRFIYKYPLVQYKMVNGSPMILGINEGVEVLKEIYDKYDSIKLGEREYQIFERQISVKEQEFGLSDKFHLYRFLTPWIALNQENYQKYKEVNSVERKDLLQRIFIGNILSMSKGLDYRVPGKIKGDIRARKVVRRLKDTSVDAFYGTFITNFLIPDYLGIGKSVSRGFGTVQRVEGRV
jgi:hypothetical protein